MMSLRGSFCGVALCPQARRHESTGMARTQLLITAQAEEQLVGTPTVHRQTNIISTWIALCASVCE
jgi:hypothetical protein